MTPAPGQPKCIAFVLCDLCIEDKRTSNKTLVGLFNRIFVTKVPALHSRLTIMLSLVDGRGEIPVKILVKHLESQEKVIEADGKAVFGDPLGVLDFVLEIRGMPLVRTGYYTVDLLASGELLSSRRFKVEVKEATK